MWVQVGHVGACGPFGDHVFLYVGLLGVSGVSSCAVDVLSVCHCLSQARWAVSKGLMGQGFPCVLVCACR